MTAAEIAAALGDARRSGAWWRCRCPAHDDRVPSLALRDGDRALIVKCWAGCDSRGVLVELRRRGLIGGRGSSIDTRPEPAPPSAGANDGTRRIALARQIWDAAREARASPVVRYLAGRAITTMPPPSSLRWAPRCWHREARAYLPAMVALVEHVERGTVGLHRTYLVRDDTGIWRRRDRASLGPVGGGAVMLAHIEPDRELLIAEGIETTASVMEATGLPGWAALSANGIRSLILPPEARKVLIAADNDANGVGQRAAIEAAGRWLAEARQVRIALPPVIGTDWADVLTGRDEEMHRAVA